MSHKKESFSSRTSQDSIRVIGGSVLLVIFLCACNFAAKIPKTATQPDMTSWTKTESPLFPANWPPTAETVWVSYTFAYGNNPAALMDGAYVTYPLSKTEWKGGVSTTTELSSDMTQAAVQGVILLDSETSAILENEKHVSEYCLKVAGLPDPNTPETKEMLAYYQTWFKYNGAFLGLIRENHADFIDWVIMNK
jgi:hypothetical protein